jgi:hypothetical protein
MQPIRLRRESRGERQRHLRGPQREVADEHSERQKRREEQDLEHARIARNLLAQPLSGPAKRAAHAQSVRRQQGRMQRDDVAHRVDSGHSVSHRFGRTLG